MTKRPAPSFTNLGMHFVAAGREVVLVQVEINVRGLLAKNARRLIKSKRGVACLSGGAVRMTIATPDDQEKAHREAEIVRRCEDYDRMAQENVRLYSELGDLKRKTIGAAFHRQSDGSGI